MTQNMNNFFSDSSSKEYSLGQALWWGLLGVGGRWSTRTRTRRRRPESLQEVVLSAGTPSGRVSSARPCWVHWGLRGVEEIWKRLRRRFEELEICSISLGFQSFRNGSKEIKLEMGIERGRVLSVLAEE